MVGTNAGYSRGVRGVHHPGQIETFENSSSAKFSHSVLSIRLDNLETQLVNKMLYFHSEPFLY